MATVPATRTWVAAEVVLASHFNNNIRDVLNYLLAPPILDIRQTTTQSIPDNTHTANTFNTEDQDSSGMHSTLTNTDRCTAVYPGWYQFSGGASFEGNATGMRGTYWDKNAAAVNGSNTLGPNNGTSPWQGATRTKYIFLNVNDYGRLMVYQNSGAARNTAVTAQEQPHISAHWLSN